MTAFDYVAIVIGVIIVTVIIGGPPLLAGRAARARGRDPEVWQLLCVIVPVIPYLYLLSIPTLRELERELEEEEDSVEAP